MAESRHSLPPDPGSASPTDDTSHDERQPLGAAPPTPPPALEPPEGTMDPRSAFYVARPSDALALETIRRQGVTITIKAPRQMGKSSLLLRTAGAATEAGKRVVLLDFQLIDGVALGDAGVLLRQFCAWLGHRLKVADRVDDYWGLPLGNIQRCTTYVEEHLLPAVGRPLVLALDEVDAVFDAPFRSDFFGMLRGWHNRRQADPAWKALDLVLVTSTEPYQLITNLNQSPFNVGQVIELADFTREQVADLNRRHGLPLAPEEEGRLLTLVGGQPYLVRLALYLVASARFTSRELFATAAGDYGPFGDHLRHHLRRLHGRPALLAGLREVLRQRSCTDEDAFFRLHGAGLVRRVGRAVVPRCQLYADYFRDRLGAEEPDRRPGQRQTAAGQVALSPREIEVLRLVADGLSNAEVAARLFISPGTVNVHLSAIYGKLEVSSRTAAARAARDRGLL